jgi:hypothetical protein
MSGAHVDRAETEAGPMPEPTRPLPRGRYWLGCYRCGRSIWLASARPRLPLCDECRSAA